MSEMVRIEEINEADTIIFTDEMVKMNDLPAHFVGENKVFELEREYVDDVNAVWAELEDHPISILFPRGFMVERTDYERKPSEPEPVSIRVEDVVAGDVLFLEGDVYVDAQPNTVKSPYFYEDFEVKVASMNLNGIGMVFEGDLVAIFPFGHVVKKY